MLTCDTSAVVGNDRRRPELPSALLDVKYDHSSIES